jgi:hypothetical protein
LHPEAGAIVADGKHQKDYLSKLYLGSAFEIGQDIIPFAVIKRVSVSKRLMVVQGPGFNLVHDPDQKGKLDDAGSREERVGVDGDAPVFDGIIDIDPNVPVKAFDEVVQLFLQCSVCSLSGDAKSRGEEE